MCVVVVDFVSVEGGVINANNIRNSHNKDGLGSDNESSSVTLKNWQ